MNSGQGQLSFWRDVVRMDFVRVDFSRKGFCPGDVVRMDFVRVDYGLLPSWQILAETKQSNSTHILFRIHISKILTFYYRMNNGDKTKVT